MIKETSPRRVSFQKLVNLVNEATSTIEMVDNGALLSGLENKEIDDVFAFLTADPKIIAKAHAYDELIKYLKDFVEEFK